MTVGEPSQRFVNTFVEADYKRYMEAAKEEARQGLREGGIPIGSVLVKDGEIISRGRNRRVQDSDPVAHAEVVCLRNAGRIGSFRGLTLVSTLLPCAFCSGAVVQFWISRVIIGELRHGVTERASLEAQGIEVVDLDDAEIFQIIEDWIPENRELWNEDIGR
ncbi:MAG: nucleoside deaminase [Chloroflexi bacterium]|nr:nucleoside deaminase [Chloroflexota bacterium]